MFDWPNHVDVCNGAFMTPTDERSVVGQEVAFDGVDNGTPFAEGVWS